jgi:hypothetical protein
MNGWILLVIAGLLLCSGCDTPDPSSSSGPVPGAAVTCPRPGQSSAKVGDTWCREDGYLHSCAANGEWVNLKQKCR